MDWKKNRLTLGVVVLVALVGGIVWATRERAPQEPTPAETEQLTKYLPEIDSEKIDELEVSRPESPKVQIKKQGDAWRVVQPLDAPADDTVIDTALEKLGELEVVRVAATNPDNHARLEVTDDKGISVTAKSKGNALAALVFGSYGGGATMVRLKGEDRVLAVRGSIKFAFNKELKDWRNRRVVDVPPSDVKSVSFANENGNWKFERGDDDEWQQAAGEKTIERFGPTKVQSIVASLARMRATDFSPEDVTPATAGVEDGAAVATLIVQSSGADSNEGDKPETEEKPEAEESKKAPAEPQEVVLRLGSAAGESDSFHLQRVGNETLFVVSNFLADKIRVNSESFQVPEPSEGESDTAPPPPPPGAGPHGGGQVPPEVMKQIQQQLKNQ